MNQRTQPTGKGKGIFPIEKFRKVQTPFYYYDTNLLRETLRAINQEAGKHEGFCVHGCRLCQWRGDQSLYRCRLPTQ